MSFSGVQLEKVKVCGDLWLAGKVVGSTDAHLWIYERGSALADRRPGFPIQAVFAGIGIPLFCDAQGERGCRSRNAFVDGLPLSLDIKVEGVSVREGPVDLNIAVATLIDYQTGILEVLRWIDGAFRNDSIVTFGGRHEEQVFLLFGCFKDAAGLGDDAQVTGTRSQTPVCWVFTRP